MGYRLNKFLAEFKKGTFNSQILDLNEDDLTDKDIVVLAAVLKQNPIGIKEIYLNDNKIKDNDALLLADAIAEMKELNSLKLSRNRISVLGASALIDKGQFKKLNLSSNLMRNGEIDAPKSCKYFEELDLSDCRLETKSISRMMKKVKVAKLNLDCNYFDNTIFDVLSAIEELVEISLEQNRISCNEESKESLSRFLETNNVLQVLNLTNNNINDKGVLLLTEKIKDHPTLKDLGLGSNRIEETGLKILQTLSKIKIDTSFNPGSDDSKAFFELRLSPAKKNLM